MVGDFNLLAADGDKNNGNVNRRLINKFRHSIDALELREVYQFGRRYTWSNEQERPTLTKIDKVLVNGDWEEFFCDAHLQALSSSASDHCPLLLACDQMMHRSRKFKFESYWAKLEGFEDVVRQAWAAMPAGSNALSSLHFKLHATAAALRSWGAKRISELRQQLAIAHEVVLQLDKAQDDRLLSAGERSLRASLKGRCLALASLERIRLKQRARLLFLKHSGTTAQFFRLKINARRRKKAIPSICQDDIIAITKEDKLQAAYDYFLKILGTPCPQLASLAFDAIGLAVHDFSDLERDITEDEAKKAIMEMPSDKAPGPDGFSATFYKKCWEIIKNDLVAALNLAWRSNS